MSKFNLLLVLTMGLNGFGCASLDRHVHHSHPLYPATVTVFNSFTQEPLWSYDVPPGYKIILDFNTDVVGNVKYQPGSARPTQMKWSLYPSHVIGLHDAFPLATPEASDVVSLPGVGVRNRLTLRPAEIEPWDAGYVPPAPEPTTQEILDDTAVEDAADAAQGQAEEAGQEAGEQAMDEMQ